MNPECLFTQNKYIMTHYDIIMTSTNTQFIKLCIIKEIITILIICYDYQYEMYKWYHYYDFDEKRSKTFQQAYRDPIGEFPKNMENMQNMESMESMGGKCEKCGNLTFPRLFFSINEL